MNALPRERSEQAEFPDPWPEGNTRRRLGVMQPYFFPHLGYIDLIVASDGWVVFDTPAYQRKGWMNRNRILHPSDGWQYITVPTVKAPLGTPVRDIRIDDSRDWRGRLLGQIDHYRRHAPHFDCTQVMVREVIERPWTYLVDLSIASLAAICTRLDLRFAPVRHTAFDGVLGEGAPRAMGPGDWAPTIAAALGARSYVNPPGGADLFDPAQFRDRGVDLIIRDLPPLTYPCPPHAWEPRLSMIDLFMWLEPQAIRAHLDRHAVTAATCLTPTEETP